MKNTKDITINKFIVAFVSLFVVSCTFNENKIDSSSSFNSEVLNIFSNRCYKCHAGGNSQGGFGFVDDANMLVSSGFIQPGDPEESLIYKKVSGTQDAGERMPKGGPYLSDAELAIVADWIQNFGLTPAIKIESPLANSYIDTTTNSVTYAISGTCNVKGATITIKVADVVGATTTCADGIFSTTVDTTGSLFTNGNNSVVANMAKSTMGVNINSTAVNLIKDLNALALALTTPSNSPVYRTVAGTGGSKVITGTDDSFITSSTDSVIFAFSGTCNSVGGTVTLKIDGATVTTATCNGTNFSGTFNSTTLSDGNHNLEASYVGTSVKSTVSVFKRVAAPTIFFESDIRPLFANQYAGNTSACIDCHYLKVGALTGSSSFTMGWWAECPGGGRWDSSDSSCKNSPVVNAGVRDNFVFRFSYAPNIRAANCTVGCSPSGTEYTYSFPIVNDSTGSVNSVRNKIVRGNPNQSFVYKKVGGPAPLLADGAKAKTDPVNATNNQMPTGQATMFDSTAQGKINQWILEGARTDN